jgi:glycine oxidase
MTKAAFSQSKVAIVGAGLMGRLLAVALAKRGAQVDIFDQTGPEAKQAAARIAAAMLAPLAESAITEDVVVQMGIYSLPRWKTLISELSNPVFFQQDGTIIVWHHQDSNDAERFTAHLHKNSLRNPKLPQAQVLDHEALQNIEPEVAERFNQGLYLPNEGQLDNRQLLDALVVELDLLSVNCHWHSPINPESLRDLGIYTQVVDCRGLGAQADWNQPSKTLRGVRGEVIRLYAPEVKLRRPTRLIHPRYPIYIAPKQNDIYVVGATEIESNDMSEMSVRSAMELLSAVYTVHSGFAEARILEMATQCRPTLQDNLPAIHIHKDHGKSDLIMINGLYRHGFMIAPAILDCTLELILQGESKTALDLGLSITTEKNSLGVAACV